MNTIFSVSNEQIGALSAIVAVELFRDMLWAEAGRIGISPDKVRISMSVNVADGGIDASVDAGVLGTQEGLIKPGRTCYQIKTGTTFKPWQDAEIKKELFGEKDNKPRETKLENLADGVKDCLNSSGTYIIVNFGLDPADNQEKTALSKTQSLLSEVRFSNPKVEFLYQSQILGFLRKIPSLALQVNGYNSFPFESHQSWSQHRDMITVLELGAEQQAFISKLQNGLRDAQRSVHVRVLGEPGIGKTRLILEAMRADDLRPQILYFYGASQLLQSNLIAELSGHDSSFSAILVVDECGPEEKYLIWNRIKNSPSRIKLITIYNDFDEAADQILEAPPLKDEQIRDILKSYDLLDEQAYRWAPLCSGSPRVAHILGENLRSNLEDLLRPTEGMANIWDRYIVGSNNQNDPEVKQRFVLFRYLALFRRLIYGPGLSQDARTLATMIQEVDPNITIGRFQSLIEESRRSKKIQGENVLYITPRALHIKLWSDWWDNYGRGFEFTSFSASLPNTLRAAFYDMFKYAKSSGVATRVVDKLLGPEGPFSDREYLKTELGADFFLALTEADPQKALKRLKLILDGWDREQTRSFKTGRRQIVHALERIILWKDLFRDGARLLLKLAEAENEVWGNNASGVFAEIFSPGMGTVAQSEASPQERFPVLVEALRSESPEKRQLGLRACNSALETRSFHRSVGPEHQGLSSYPELWVPKTYEELFDGYRRVWMLLEQQIPNVELSEKQRINEILLHHARGLITIPSLTEMVLNTLNELANESWADKKSLLSEVSGIRRYERGHLIPEVAEQLQELEARIVGNDYVSLLKRYVGMTLLEDHFDEEGNHFDQAQRQIERLAEQALADRSLLTSSLDWLLTPEALKAHLLGYEIGKRDAERTFLPILLDAYRTRPNSNPSLLSGYFRSINESSPNEFYHELKALVEDRQLVVLTPSMIISAGITDQSALLILRLAQQGLLDIRLTWGFSLSPGFANLSQEIFTTWIHRLLEIGDSIALSTALILFEAYYLRAGANQNPPEDLSLSLLLHPALFKPGDRDQMAIYYWYLLAELVIQKYPPRSLEIATTIIENFETENTIIDDSFRSQEILAKITELYPVQVWNQIKPYLGPPITSLGIHLRDWLRGNPFMAQAETVDASPLSRLPRASLWEWVDSNINERAWYLATFVPKTLTAPAWENSLARELLVRYGDREDVRRNLHANYGTESWMGSRSEHLTQRRDQLRGLREHESNDNVRRWLDEYIEDLGPQIEEEKLREEIRGF